MSSATGYGRFGKKIAASASVPVINALTDANHPCEMAADLYALSKIRNDFTMDHFLFCGVTGNIRLAWKEASEVMGFSLEQCCIPGYEMDGVPSHHCIRDAIRGKRHHLHRLTAGRPSFRLPRLHRRSCCHEAGKRGCHLKSLPAFFTAARKSQTTSSTPTISSDMNLKNICSPSSRQSWCTA